MAETLPTIKVKRDGFDYVIINRSDFDPKQHVIYRERLQEGALAPPPSVTLPDAAECAVKHMGDGRFAILHDGKELPYARSLDRATAKSFEDLSLPEKQAFLLKQHQEHPG